MAVSVEIIDSLVMATDDFAILQRAMFAESERTDRQQSDNAKKFLHVRSPFTQYSIFPEPRYSIR